MWIGSLLADDAGELPIPVSASLQGPHSRCETQAFTPAVSTRACVVRSLNLLGTGGPGGLTCGLLTANRHPAGTVLCHGYVITKDTMAMIACSHDSIKLLCWSSCGWHWRGACCAGAAEPADGVQPGSHGRQRGCRAGRDEAPGAQLCRGGRAPPQGASLCSSHLCQGNLQTCWSSQT